MTKEHPALTLLTTLIEDAKVTPMNTELPEETNIKEHTYAAQMELTNVPEDSLKQWTNMPPLSEELYNELVKEFNNERHYFFNDSYTLED